jgi:hypothetical protein
MVLGLVVAGVGVVVLAVAGYLMFGPKGDTRKNTKSGSQTPVAAQGGNPDQPGPDGKGPDKQPVVPPVVQVALAAPGAELTNLLPVKSQHVLHLFFKDLLDSPLGDTALQPGVFNDQEFKQRLGFSLKKIDDLIRAESYTERWAFTVVHVHDVLNEQAVKDALGLEPAAGSPIHGQPFFKVTKNNAWLEQLGRLSLGTVPPPRMGAAKGEDRPLLVRLHDPQTLVFADAAPMQELLARGPQKKVQPAKAPDAEQAGVTGRQRPGPRGRPTPEPTPAVAGAQGNAELVVPGGDGTQPATGAAPAALAGAYTTLTPALRAILEKLEKSSADARLLFSSVTDLDAARLDSRLPGSRFRPIWDVAHALHDSRQGLHLLGASLARKGQNDPSAYAYQNEIYCDSDADAKSLHKDLQDKVAPELARFIERLLGLKVDVPRDEPAQQPGVQFPVGPGPVAPGPVGSGLRPAPGPRIIGSQPRPNPVTEAPKVDPTKSRIAVTQTDKVVVFTLDLVLTHEASARLNAVAELVMQGFKGELELAGAAPHRHDLASAVKRLGEQGIPDKGVPAGHFPRGVFPRADSKARLASDPAQRISWMAGLLPFLQQESVYARIKFDAAWKHPSNWMAARTLVPEFLDPAYPAATRFAPYPGIPVPLGGTHFVGIAGIGQDAPDYSAGDPAVVTKLGVFGYDRMTPLEEIQKNRGLSSTAVMVQVPYNGPAGITPWMAGGGSTIRGVPETNSAKPFVSTTHDGKRGTFVLMADGSVRFVAEDVKDEVFKAMCTIKGPAPDFFDVDRAAPVVRGKTNAPSVAKAASGVKGQAPANVEQGVKTAPQPKAAATEPAPKIDTSGTGGGWQEYVSKEGGYSVDLPGPPKLAVEKLPDSLGSVTLHMAFADQPKDKRRFRVAYFDTPPEAKAFPQDQQFAMYRAILMPNDPNAKVTSEKELKLGQYPGRELEIESPKDGNGIVRIFIADSRVHLLVVAGQGITTASPELERVFDSFKLLPRAAKGKEKAGR